MDANSYLLLIFFSPFLLWLQILFINWIFPKAVKREGTNLKWIWYRKYIRKTKFPFLLEIDYVNSIAIMWITLNIYSKLYSFPSFLLFKQLKTPKRLDWTPGLDLTGWTPRPDPQAWTPLKNDLSFKEFWLILIVTN